MEEFQIHVIDKNFLSQHPSLPLDYQWYEDIAVLNSQYYQKIFNKRRKDDSDARKKNAYVKISYGKKSIVRKCVFTSVANVNGKCTIYISSASACILTGQYNTNQCVKVSKGCIFRYFLSHPNSATMIAFQLGFLGLLLSIFSIFLSFCSCLKK